MILHKNIILICYIFLEIICNNNNLNTTENNWDEVVPHLLDYLHTVDGDVHDINHKIKQKYKSNKEHNNIIQVSF